MIEPELPAEPDPRVLELAKSVVDEVPVDWEGARQTASDLSDTLERLRQIESLAVAHRRERAVLEPARGKSLFRWGGLGAIEKLGEGGFAEVWRAWEGSLAREVALKLRRGDPGAPGTSNWLKEAQRLARVRHPNVLQVYGADVHDGRPGLWTELIHGRTLEQRLLGEGPCGAAEAALIGMQICAALEAVHGAGLVHGDIKTRNLMREGAPAPAGRPVGAGRIVLMDFGTASEAEKDAPGGAAAGTPLFAAPELLAGGLPSVASDLYALGVVLYRLVTGRFPVDAASMAELRERHAGGQASPLRELRPDLPAAFSQVVQRLLEPDPAQRFRNAEAVEQALAATIASPPAATSMRAPRLRLALAALGGAAALALVWALAHAIPEWTRAKFHVVPSSAPVAVRMVQAVSDTALVSLYGLTVTSPGDLDGDGLPDLLVGAPDEEKARGHVYVFRGRPDGTFEKWYVLTGPEQGQFGSKVAGLGDIDGDHRPDFAVAAGGENAKGVNSGAVYIFRSSDGPNARPAARITGQFPREFFGSSIAGAGDVNGDGYADFVIGAPFNSAGATGAGCAYLFLGGPTIHTQPDVRLGCTNALSAFGYAVAGLGDVNGDGFDDFAVSADFDGTRGTGAGRVAVYFGGRTLRADPDMNLYGAEGDCWFGTAVTGLGDVNGDGFADFAVGAERDSGFARRSGRVYVYHGGQPPNPEPALALLGEGPSAHLGHSLACGSDLDGDGRPDLVAGEFSLSTIRSIGGGALIFSGGPKMDAFPDMRLLGDEENGNFGWSLASIPAADGRSFGELVVGSPYAHPGGSIHVFRFSRYSIARPRSGERWAGGGSATVSWLGAEPAELDWAPWPGEDWRPLAHRVGGRDSNNLQISVPAEARGAIRLRLRPSNPLVSHDAVSDTVRVGLPGSN